MTRRVSASTVELGLLATGIALLAVLILRTGVSGLIDDISLVGWGFFAVLASEVPIILASAIGWMLAIHPSHRDISLARLCLFRVAGEGINHLTPTATIGGEFARARLAAPYIGNEESTSAVTLAKFTETAGQYLFVAIGLLVLIPTVDALEPYQAALTAIVTASIAAVIGLGFLLRRGLFGLAARLLSRVGRLRLTVGTWRSQIDAIDGAIERSLRQRPVDLITSTLVLALSFGGRTIEIWILLRLLGVDGSLMTCLGIEVLSALINSLFFFMPAKIGTQEGGKMVIFSLLGLPPHKGLALGLVRRARELAWDTTGLAIYAAEQRRQAAEQRRQAAR